MKKLLTVGILVFMLFFCFLQCKRVPPPQEDYSGWAEELTSIPAEYGKLVSITTIAAYPNWAQLWFEDEEKVIRMVRIKWTDNLIHKDIITIPRD